MATFNNYDESTNVDVWLEDYASDPNLLWVTEHQHVKNLIDELIRRAEEGYRRGREDAGKAVRKERNLPANIFGENELTARFVLSIIERCAEQAEGKLKENETGQGAEE